MTDTKDKRPDRLQDWIDAYGADRARWPDAARQATAAVDDEAFAVRAQDDRAFDRLIGQARDAADAEPAPDAVMARILARVPGAAVPADVAPEARDGAGDVVAFDGHRGRVGRRVLLVVPRDLISAAAALAASLVLGLVIGSTDVGRSTAEGLGDLAGLRSAVTNVQTSALDDILAGQDDEEIL